MFNCEKSPPPPRVLKVCILLQLNQYLSSGPSKLSLHQSPLNSTHPSPLPSPARSPRAGVLPPEVSVRRVLQQVHGVSLFHYFIILFHCFLSLFSSFSFFIFIIPTSLDLR